MSIPYHAFFKSFSIIMVDPSVTCIIKRAVMLVNDSLSFVMPRFYGCYHGYQNDSKPFLIQLKLIGFGDILEIKDYIFSVTFFYGGFSQNKF